MLDKETKDKIDDLRQILVGKVTDPRSQVEQITNALLYKFMNDMDEQSVSTVSYTHLTLPTNREV